MNTTAAPDLRLLAPVFAGRFAVIVAALAALIARAFLRNPTLAPLIIPLCRRLTCKARHLAAQLAKRATQPSGIKCGRGAAAPRKRSGAPRPPIPTTHAWLVRTLGYEAAGYASQLSHLLAEPGVSDLLEAAPAARRLLNPLCRMLGLSPAALRAVPDAPLHGVTPPDTPPSGVAPPATGVFPFKNPESAVAGTAPPETPPPDRDRARPTFVRSPPPCPHVRWPWFTRPDSKRD